MSVAVGRFKGKQLKTDKKTLIIGLDGGGSRSRLLIEPASQERFYREYPLSIKYTDFGVAAAVERLAGFITEGVQDEWDELSIVLCLSGAGNELRNQEFKTLLAEAFPGRIIRCHLESDSSFTLAAAYPNAESGLLLIAGTGSVAIGRNKEGAIYKAGGWGRMLGDEGSGYWLGLQALQYYTKAMDKGETEGALVRAIEATLEEAQAIDRGQLRAILYSGALNPSVFAPLLFTTISDPASHYILRQGANRLAELITILESKASFDSVLTLHGSVVEQKSYRDLIEEATGGWYEIDTLDSKQILEYACERAAMLQ